jgi:hypothetical protein
MLSSFRTRETRDHYFCVPVCSLALLLCMVRGAVAEEGGVWGFNAGPTKPSCCMHLKKTIGHTNCHTTHSRKSPRTTLEAIRIAQLSSSRGSTRSGPRTSSAPTCPCPASAAPSPRSSPCCPRCGRPPSPRGPPSPRSPRAASARRPTASTTRHAPSHAASSHAAGSTPA